MGRLCAASGIDVQAVHEIFVADTKLNISKRYLRPGAAFGGSCLPKDVRAFSSLATRCHVQTPIVDAILRSNDAHKSYCFTKVTQGLQPGAKLLVNGLSFKKNTDDLRESPFVDLVEHLIEAGYDVMVHDPNVTVGTLIGQNLTFAFQSLPDLKRILLDLPAVESMSFDRLVDVRGDVDPKLAARCKSCVSIAQWQ
jgi:GDP-mannose 6-dehydrogenase